MRRLASYLLTASVLAAGGGGVDAVWAQDEKPYSVVDGKVDKATFNGYRRYTDACLRCHGPDGSGSSYAPDLNLVATAAAAPPRPPAAG